jgi:hypothetical protein
VVLGVQAGKSNRAIAKELSVDEGTVRLDRKFLTTPENERSIRVSWPKKSKEPKKEKPVRELTPEERRQQHWELMLSVVNLWITQEDLILPDLELHVLPEAGKLLHRHPTHNTTQNCTHNELGLHRSLMTYGAIRVL